MMYLKLHKKRRWVRGAGGVGGRLGKMETARSGEERGMEREKEKERRGGGA